MCKQVVWAPRAELEYLSTLDFWIEHNKSSAYSQKIIAEVEATEIRIMQFPYSNPIAYQTPQKEIRRAIVLLNFSLFYEVFHDKIEIVFFFDNRDNPEKLPF
ncbi:hypothetical protein RCZ04_17410 [Capnocytophaga sp. HP1101]